MRWPLVVLILIATCSLSFLHAAVPPVRSKTGLVISASDIASRIGAAVLTDGGNAVDAAVATAFALAVTHPTAGNIGGGGFLLHRAATGDTAAYDFREAAPASAAPTMFLKDGKYDADIHHNSYLSVGVPVLWRVCTLRGKRRADCRGSAWWSRRSLWLEMASRSQMAWRDPSPPFCL